MGCSVRYVPMQGPLQIGLVGAGVFAGYHGAKIAAHARANLVGVFDPDMEKAHALASQYDAPALSAEDIYARSDAIIIACPATHHAAMAMGALEAGCHILIEKPIAIDLQNAEQILNLAKEKGSVVQIGHQERMVLRAIGLDKVTETPRHIRAVRANLFSPRGTDTSVTLDLMTHDIDLCLALFRALPTEVRGDAKPVQSQQSDMANAFLSFPNGEAELLASRVAEIGQRHMEITYESGSVFIDFNAKTLRHTTKFDLNDDFGDDIRARDSLGAATDIFIGAVLDGTDVLVSAEDGINAMRVALQIDGVL